MLLQKHLFLIKINKFVFKPRVETISCTVIYRRRKINSYMKG